MKKQTYALVGLTCFLLDRITKIWALQYCLDPYIITPWCRGEIAVNKGIAWSIGAYCSPAILTGITIAVTVITAAIGIYFLLQRGSMMSSAGIVILAGALGNVVDRWLYGGVIDFIVVHYGVWYFPTFNIADVAICCGALWWCLEEMKA